MFEMFTHMWDSVFAGASDTVQIIGAVGLSLFALTIGISIVFLAQSVLAVSKGVGSHISQAGQVWVGTGKLIESVGTAISDSIGFPVALIEANKEIALARIEAEAQSTTVELINGERSIKIGVSGANANDRAEGVMRTIGGPSQTIYTAAPQPFIDVTPGPKKVAVKSRPLLSFPGKKDNG